MTALTAAVFSGLVCLLVGILIGWLIFHKQSVRPNLEEIAAYLDGVVEQEDYDARIRRNERRLHDGGRTTMPRGNEGPPAKIRQMRLVRSERRK